MQTLLATLHREFMDRLASFSGGVHRDLHFPDIPDKIMVAIGMRRVGKTYFLFQNILNLLKEIAPSRILYLNFEDDRLFPADEELLRGLIDGFYSMYPENHDQTCYLFLDEIQNVDNWHRVVRRVFDTKKVKIYLTGSSAKLLSKEIATTLRGRSFAIEVWPFSMNEYASAHQFDLGAPPYAQKALDQQQAWLSQYLTEGGFPETTHVHQAEDRYRILQDYVSTVIFRDIVERHNITNITLIKYMIKMLLNHVGQSFSVNKMWNDLKSQGFSVGKNTIHDYLDHIEDAYLAFTVPLYSGSVRKSQTNPRKIYAIDTGLVRAYSAGFAANVGRLFENLVYLDLRRRNHEVFYYLTASRKEIDFLSRDLSGKWHMHQVCWSLQDKTTLAREESALKEAESELGIKGSIITPQSYFTTFLN